MVKKTGRGDPRAEPKVAIPRFTDPEAAVEVEPESAAETAAAGIEALEERGARAIPTELPVPWPLRFAASGRYVHEIQIPAPIAPSQPIPASAPQPAARLDGARLIPLFREELRLDIDGRFPQMTASGTIRPGLSTSIHWIARLTPAGANVWTGVIWYKDGNAAAFPYTQVRITVVRSLFPHQRTATVKFSGGGAPLRRSIYRFRSPHYHHVEFEFDCATGVTPVTSIETCAHPNRPPSIPCQTLTIEEAFLRAGFQVTKSGGDSVVPLAGAGPDARWSDMEMHDAMQTYWSRFANQAQWSLWAFFASLHESGTGLGGVMFDDIGPNHRQGTAIFNDSFIKNAPPGDPNPAAWVRRMRFWTACHEMGHGFNLAHSWQKSLGAPYGSPWIPLADEPEARSFMNYPYNVAGGQTAFFSDFEYRFSDGELLFMRHAPARFVEMGNADWFDHHGFEQARVSPEPTFHLDVRANRSKPEFEFLEPIVLELKLRNISAGPQLIDENLLSNLERLTLVVKKRGKPARLYIPYARYCRSAKPVVLPPGEARYDSVFVSAGQNGFDLAEPGWYTIQAALHLDEEDVTSEPFHLRIAPPTGYDEEYLAQDFFSDDVGRILAFDGSRFLATGNGVLREVAERLSTRRVALHAQVALGSALARAAKVLDLGNGKRELTSAKAAGGQIGAASADPKEAHAQLQAALFTQEPLAAESLGHVDYKYYADRYSDWLADEGDTREAARVQDELYKTLAERRVLDRVLREIRDRKESYGRQRR